MPHSIATRPPRGELRADFAPTADPAILQFVLHDASHYPGGHAAALALPTSEAEVAALLRHARAVLPIGAQTSITGGATPQGELVLSTAAFDAIGKLAGGRVDVQAGVALGRLQSELAARGAYYPPVPSYQVAFLGGTIATNAAGPATFKYGSTRAWVERISVVLASGTVLDINRGACIADPGAMFTIHTPAGRLMLPAPRYRMPAVPKCSAGYYAAIGMDLIDLFIGAEGTLGVITEATIRVVSPAPSTCVVLIGCAGEAQALALVANLRAAGLASRASRDPHGVDVAAIEYIDARGVELLRAAGCDQQNDITIDPAITTLLLAQVELGPSAAAPGGALAQLRQILSDAGVLASEAVPPHQVRRAAQLLALREAVPLLVNARVAAAQREADPAITKVAGDMIVPFEQMSAMIGLFRAGFERIGVDHAIWGHVSDGNLHANAMPRSLAELHAAQQVLFEVGQHVIELGGSPLAEHGVGRNPVKQALLRQLYGADGIAQMRAIKRVLDPEWKLAPGVLF